MCRSITAFYLAILALLYAVLALQVMRLRQSNRVLFGDGDNARLRSAIRVHANFVEYVPIIALMVALLEMSGTSALRVHLLMGGAAGVPPAASARHVRQTEHAGIQVGRVGGIALTLVLLIASALIDPDPVLAVLSRLKCHVTHCKYCNFSRPFTLF